jgi:hypothetical protein
MAWNGDSSHTIDRIERGTHHVPYCYLSMLGGIQPNKLRTYLATTNKENLQDDGMIHRFQVLVWPDMEPEFEYVDRAPNQIVIDQVEKLCRNLVSLQPESPLQFRFSDDAQDIFIEWYVNLENRLRRGDE